MTITHRTLSSKIETGGGVVVEGINSALVSYPMVQLLDKLDRRLEDISQGVRTAVENLEKRVNALESRNPYQDEIVLRFLKTEKDFAGFERRVDVGFADMKAAFQRHEEFPGHTQTLTRIAQLESEITNMKTRTLAEDKVAEYVRISSEKADTQRRWMLGFVFGNFIAMVGLLAKLLGWY